MAMLSARCNMALALSRALAHLAPAKTRAKDDVTRGVVAFSSHQLLGEEDQDDAEQRREEGDGKGKRHEGHGKNRPSSSCVGLWPGQSWAGCVWEAAAGFPVGTFWKTIVAGVAIPAGLL